MLVNKDGYFLLIDCGAVTDLWQAENQPLMSENVRLGEEQSTDEDTGAAKNNTPTGGRQHEPDQSTCPQ